MRAADEPTVFISHSAKEPEAERVLNALAGALRAAGLGVWWDRERLGPGDVWRQEIAKAMHLCRAAIVLLSSDALGSAWVIKETAVLTQRHAIAPGFAVIPVLVGGVTPADLGTRDWEPMALAELQAVTLADGEDPPAVLVDRLRGLLERHPPDSPERRLENHVVQKLTDIHPSALATAAHPLGLTFSDWDHDQDRALAYVRRLLEVPLERQAVSLDLLADADAKVAGDVLEAIAPHGWIAAEAAAAIRAVAASARGRRGVGLNTTHKETCEMYVRAGFFDWRPLAVEGGTSERDRAELADRARAHLLDWLGYREDEADAAELDAELAEALGDAESDLPFLVLPPEAATTDVVADLGGRWPDVPLVLRCGADTAEEFERRALGEIAYLRPPVDAAREAEVLPLRRSKLRSYTRRSPR